MNGLDCQQKELISGKVTCFFNELLAKFDEGTYSAQTYQDLLATFSDLNTVTQQSIELALAWKYGKESVEALRRNPKYLPIIDDLWRLWPENVAARFDDADSAFLFLQENLGTERFVTNAFLTHLSFPEDFPIVDQHNLRALRYFLDIAGVGHTVRRTVNRNGLQEIHLLRHFVEFFSAEADVDVRSFDKYLMMFGKHVAPN